MKPISLETANWRIKLALPEALGDKLAADWQSWKDGNMCRRPAKGEYRAMLAGIYDTFHVMRFNSENAAECESLDLLLVFLHSAFFGTGTSAPSMAFTFGMKLASIPDGINTSRKLAGGNR